MQSKTDKPPARYSATVIGAGTVVSGDIIFCGDMRIDGEVRGNVSTPSGQDGTLTVGEKGHVAGAIEVERLIVSGLITGNVNACDFLKLQAKAQLRCDLEYANAEIHSGAVIEGRMWQWNRAEGGGGSTAQIAVPLEPEKLG